MQRVKNLRGLALGVLLSLVGTVFVTIPAAQASETAVVVTPSVGAATESHIVHGEPFELFVRYGSSVADTSANFSYRYEISSGSYGVVFEESKNGSTWTGAASSSPSISSLIGELRGVQSISDYIRFSLTGATSKSPNVTLTITPYINKDDNASLTGPDLVGTPYTITFVPYSAFGATLSVPNQSAGDRGVTASVTVTQGSINWSQLNGFFTAKFTTDAAVTVTNGATFSAIAGDYERTGQELRDGGFSMSPRVITWQASASPATSTSVQLFYAASALGSANPVGHPGIERALLATVSSVVVAQTITGVTMSAVAGDNVLQSGPLLADARFNSAFSIRAYAHSTAQTVSMAISSAFTVSAVGSDMEFGAAAGVTINGTSYTSSAALLAAGFTQPAGTTTITVATFGQDSDGSNDSITFRLTSQLQVTTLTVTLKTPTLTPVFTPTAVAGLAGQTKSFTVGVEDQWGATPVRTDMRIKAVMVLSSSESEAVSSTVSNGTAVVQLAPTPATRTGSGTVTFTLQTFNQNTQNWDSSTSTDEATWNVYSYVAGTDAFVSRSATASASISYGASAYSWSGVVAVGVVNSFSDVLVSAPGLVIQNNDQQSQTASDALTVAANGKQANLRFAGKKSGTYTVTFTQGTATTTSLVTIHAAGSDKGASITWDTTTIESGKTKVITGTLVDANGNVVDTTHVGSTAGDSGTASILISYIGTAGIVAGTLPSETDADGKFRISVLTAAADSGTLTITATYMPQGASTVAANRVTSVQAVNVSPAAAPEVNAVIGSYNGRWAVRVENAKGSVVSVKAGNRWVKFSALNNNYLFSRKSVVGRTMAVSVWVDGELQNSQTITIK